MFKNLLLMLIFMVLMFGCKKKEVDNSVQTNNEVKKEVVENVGSSEKKVQNDSKISENSVLTFKVIEGKPELEIYSKDEKKNEEKLLTKVTDFYFDHYHSKEFVNNSLFVIRRTGDTVKWTKWSDELWKYDLSTPNGKKIFDVQGLDFRVSSDGKYVAVAKDFSPKWSDEKTLEYKNPSGEGTKTYQLK